jgi:hypothetical protein
MRLFILILTRKDKQPPIERLLVLVNNIFGEKLVQSHDRLINTKI